VLEVETPVLCRAGAVDEHLDPIPVLQRSGEEPLYLVTSPEHSMKRLLAEGSGPVFQITRAFRAGDRGRLHNPEFTILEWYRPGMDHLGLMDEVEDLVRGIFCGAGTDAPMDLSEQASRPFERIAYRDAFRSAIGIDPFRTSIEDLGQIALRHGAVLRAQWREAASLGGFREEDRDGCLNLLLALAVEKTLGADRFTFLVDYPATQAALARLRPGDPPVAERFELYVRGIELANGYHELTDPAEQERRFVEANSRRRAAGRPVLPVDRLFLDALRAGVPACAGVALGLDRVVMLAVGAETIDDVIAFPIERA